MPDDSNKIPRENFEEISKLPHSVAQVETAIPAFIGYTKHATDTNDRSLLNKPKRITSLLEYQNHFGTPCPEENLSVEIEENLGVQIVFKASIGEKSKFLMYYSMQMYFANGGGPCWIVSVGDYQSNNIVFNELKRGLDSTKKIDEITLYVYPDAQNLSTYSDFYNLLSSSLLICKKLKDRFTVMDIWQDKSASYWTENINLMRNSITNEENMLKYGATYFPNIESILDYYYDDETKVDIVHTGGNESLSGTLSELKIKNDIFYNNAKQALKNLTMVLPPSASIVGVYATVDGNRGVWKAPANVNLNNSVKPVINITNEEQRDLNVDASAGKSVNVIRSFAGRGSSIIWGARTLAGNSNEWRYIPVRRFFNMVEESLKKSTTQFVFEPNERDTWNRVKFMINNFLKLQWEAGALMGTTPEQAYYVRVGLNETMSESDVWEGKMIIEIGMSVVRPAEFILLRYTIRMLSP